MSVNASWLRMFLEMQRRHRFRTGQAIALGVQDVMFNHATADNLLSERKVEPKEIPEHERTFALSRNQKQFTQDPRHYMSVKDLFRMIGYESLVTLDAFENDGPDLLWDLCKPIPVEWHNKYDVLFDIGVMEHTADIFQALENVGNLVKVGGWIALYLPMVSPINSCIYHPNPPFYFDILAGNGFHNFDAWINWMPDWDQQNDIRTVWLNYKYNDDVYIWRPRFYTIMFFIAQKREHVGDFKTVLQNFYQEWFAGVKLFGTTQDDLIKKQAVRSDTAAIAVTQESRSSFARSLINKLRGSGENTVRSRWMHPTAMNEPTAPQLARFPLNESGVPHAPECVVAPVDSRPQSDIPEQMAVGSPLREQLYL
jgi:hypothetical protein